MQQQKRLPAPPTSDPRTTKLPRPSRTGASKGEIAVAIGITAGFIVLGMLYQFVR